MTDSTTPTSHANRRTQTERRADAERRLLEAARQLVARKGWVGMTLAEVGEEAGYSRGLAAHHFGSKAGLLRALAAYVNRNFMCLVDLELPRRTPGLDALLGFVGVYLGRGDTDWTNTRALLALMAEAVTEDAETREILGDYNRQVQGYLAEHIRTGIASGDIRRSVDAATGATLILATLRGVMLQYLLDPVSIELPAVQRQMLDFVETALAAPR
ncbi:TetR/AcrR family transcriptional regulator [Pseudomonas sp. H9]|uniref:TetR/AcrR family transcriptional regulator n=1 Tax=Pseudomonas sp. H9 TaxID=483968 RepID=UPI001058195F|nr:TetR/AcrR family transcriptional regulator [Pseudomonas sp. H9]TDF80745.1 TetR/AcrR family transcriptional regulator [Pseudomonas sp. H9]